MIGDGGLQADVPDAGRMDAALGPDRIAARIEAEQFEATQSALQEHDLAGGVGQLQQGAVRGRVGHREAVHRPEGLLTGVEGECGVEIAHREAGVVQTGDHGRMIMGG